MSRTLLVLAILGVASPAHASLGAIRTGEDLARTCRNVDRPATQQDQLQGLICLTYINASVDAYTFMSDLVAHEGGKRYICPGEGMTAEDWAKLIVLTAADEPQMAREVSARVMVLMAVRAILECK